MGTSLSGLTPATTFDGLLKVGDNDPLTADLKAISTGDGADTILQLSTTALQIGGATGMYWDNTNSRLGVGTDSPNTKFEVNGSIRSSGDGTQIFEFSNATLGQFRAVFGSVGFRLGSGMFVGGADGGPAANTRLHIKGSGANADTTSLLVQNSAGTDLFEIKDNGEILAGNSQFVSLGNIKQNLYKYLRSGNAFLYLSNTSGNMEFKSVGDYDFYASGSIISKLTSDGNLGIGETTPTARLHVKGEAPSGDPLNNPTALLVENSAGTDLFKLQDDGDLNIKSNSGIFATTSNVNLFSYSSGGGGVLDVNPSNSNSIKLRVRGANDVYLIETNPANDAVGIGLTSANAKLHIKGSAPVEDPPGSGTFTNPVALLVEDNAGTDLFKVSHSGQVSVAGYFSAGNSVLGSAYLRVRDTKLYPSVSGTGVNVQANATNNPPHASAVLQADSTTQGFLPPRMTQAQREAIANPVAAGLMVYQTDGEEGVYVNTSTGWKQMQLIG